MTAEPVGTKAGANLESGCSDLRQASTGVPTMSVNKVPLPYSRIAVQHADFALNETELRSFLGGEQTWFETDYVVFRRGND
ncbi:MAG: hypothetical protein DMG30_21065 [Acidobacteria bacterium]|nr:MAG: hypothetical protein DMG30_21065 [Acidobacteriota bacterium]